MTAADDASPPRDWAPGQVVVDDAAAAAISTLPGAPRTTLVVVNTGDRPVQVGSHFHFAQTNTALTFDRTAAHGLRLDVAAGTAVRFEPGVEREVVLVPIAGARVVPGLTVPAPGHLGDRLDGGATADAPPAAPGGFGTGDEG